MTVPMFLVEEPITLDLVKQCSLGDFTKAVADIERRIMVIGSDLHVDCEQQLLEHGSEQKNLWGFNIYHDITDRNSWLEYDSMINVRPSDNNRSRTVESVEIQARITAMVEKLIK